MAKYTIGITGGIGSGKSVVSRILRAWGHEVYDCDSEAKRLMNVSDEIRTRIVDEVCAEAFDGDGKLQSSVLGAVVFADAERLARLNAIVHSAVLSDVRRRAAEASGEIFFVESAIANGSGLTELLDCEWNVTAPETVRIERVQRRSGLDATAIKARIEAQKAEEQVLPHPLGSCVIDNGGNTGVLPQLEKALKILPTAVKMAKNNGKKM